MNSERLKQVEEIYHAVSEIPSVERENFLAKNCGDDQELRREIESLLSVRDNSDSFLDTPPESLAAEMFLGVKKPANLAGREITHYRIIELLGSGGMGEVYLAEDAKLRRRVALKLLPPQFSADADRQKRFVQEARAVSALNHPNIITIYEIGEADNVSFMATEFIDGQTLREHFAGKPLTWQEGVKIAVQVAGALESAHSVGIIHRDIKPANIMIRPDGIVKVLDFGLAKLTAPDSGSIETVDLTAPYRVMGTINYMSPEQALGERLDARTDIFSFGVVLYEMLTGDLPFGGASGRTIDNSANHPTLPSVSESNAEIPAALSQIVKRALKKDRDERYQNFADLRADLKNLLRDSQTSSLDYAVSNKNLLQTDPNEIKSTTKPNDEIGSGSGRSTFWLIAPLVILLAAAAAAFGIYRQYFYVPSPALAHFQTTKFDVLTAHGLAQTAAISPDGKMIAYAKSEDDGRQSLWLRQTASAGDTQIVPPGSAKYDYLKFSPDGNYLYFVGTEGAGQPSSLFQMTTLGRNQRKIIAGIDSQVSFSPDGGQIIFIRVSDSDNSIVIADSEGGNERILRTRKRPEVYGDETSWSPDGKLIAVPTLTNGATYAGGMAVVDVATGTETKIPLKEEKLLRISQIAWVNDGQGLIYTPYAADMGARYQIRYAAYPSGEVQNVTNDLSSYENFSLTADSQTIVAVQRDYSMGIWLTPENDFTSAVSINSKTGADDGENGISWTKDGKIIYVTSEGGAQNIWRMDADGGNPKPLTTDYKVAKTLPVLSVGGDSIIYLSRAEDPVTKELIPGWTFFQMDTDGQKMRQILDKSNASIIGASANEDWLVYTSRADGKRRIWKSPLKGGEAVTITDVDSSTPVISRDGKSVAYFIREKNQPLKLGVSSIDGGTLQKIIDLPVTANLDAGIRWNKTGSGILFVNTLGTTSNVWTQPLDGSRPTPLTAFKEFQIAKFALNPQGTRLAVARGSRNQNVVLIKNIRK